MNLPKSKHKLGYTNQEVNAILKKLGIFQELFSKKFGINTGAISETGEYLLYHYDAKATIKCCLENRDKYPWEWD